MLHVPRMQQNSRSSPFVVKVLMLFQYMSTYAESSEWWVQMSADVFPCSADDGPLLAHWPQWPSQVYDLRGLQNHWKRKPPLKRFAGWATVLVPPSYPRSFAARWWGRTSWRWWSTMITMAFLWTYVAGSQGPAQIVLHDFNDVPCPFFRSLLWQNSLVRDAWLEFSLKRRWGTKLPNYITDRITKRQGTPSFIKLRPCFNAMAVSEKEKGIT